MLALAAVVVWLGVRPTSTSGPAAATETLAPTETPAPEPSPTSTSSHVPVSLPADIAGKVWLVDREELSLSPPRQGFVGGTLDGSIHEVFPVDWNVLAFDGLRVVTVDQVDGTFTVSDRTTKAPALVVPTGLQIQQVTLTADALYWTGSTDGGKEDGGVWVQSFDGSPARALVPPGPYPSDFSGPPIGRTPLLVSPSGKTLATSLCDVVHCLPSVIDAGTGGETMVLSSRFAAEGFVATAGYVTDDVVVVFESTANDLPPSSLTAFDRETLKERWTISATYISPGGGYLTSDGSSVIQAIEEQAEDGVHYGLEQVVLSDGTRTSLWSYLVGDGPQHSAWGALSGDRHVVLLTTGLQGDLAAGGGITSFDVLDLTSGSVTEAAGYIDARGD